MHSVDELRSHFPALQRVHAGHPVAYFDGPGGTQVPRMVADAMTDYLFHHNANTHWVYPTSEETDAALLGAREAFADFFKCRAEEVVFGNNMSTIAFHLGRALGREWGPGDEIVVTELDHQANVAPWQQLVKEHGVTLKVARMVPVRGQLDFDHLASLLGPRTKLLAIGAASNAIGTISDVRRACELAREVGALSFVDAVHYAPHALVDVQAIGCDFLACSAYKFYGPHVGILFGRQELLARVDVARLDPAPNTAPERLETGTQNHEGIVGAAAAVDFFASLAPDAGSRRARLEAAFAELHERGEVVLRRLWNGLAAVDGVSLFGPRPGQPRTPTVSFTVRGRQSEDVARHLAARGVFVSNGDFYATTVVQRLGCADCGLVRAGAAAYTTESEIDRLVHGVAELTR